MATRDTIIEWKCYTCREGGKFANLPDTTMRDIRDRITRGHQLRAPENSDGKTCHDLRGITKVKAIVNGKTLDMSTIEALLSKSPQNVAPESRETDDLEHGNTPAPSTAK